jgi:hypothetical protein
MKRAIAAVVVLLTGGCHSDWQEALDTCVAEGRCSRR